MALEKIHAPFTIEAVQTLNEYQTDTGKARQMHAFTCAERGDGNHGEEGGDRGTLIATVDGWVCPFCAYTQDWAHGFMADATRTSKPHPWETTDEGEIAQQKLKRVDKALTEYLALQERLPTAPGISVMVECLNQRKLEILNWS
jgi:hypothetical protein